MTRIFLAFVFTCLSVSVSAQCTMTLLVEDETGRTILEKQLDRNSSSIQTDLDLSNLESGVYILQVRSLDGDISSMRIIRN